MFRKIMVRLKIFSVLNSNIDVITTFVRASCISSNSNDPEKAEKALTTMMSWLYREFKDTDITEKEYNEIAIPFAKDMVNKLVKRG